MKQTLLTLLAVLAMTNAAWAGDKVNERWQQAILAAIDSFPEHGGYYTGGRPNALFSKTTWRGLHDAYQMTASDERPCNSRHARETNQSPPAQPAASAR